MNTTSAQLTNLEMALIQGTDTDWAVSHDGPTIWAVECATGWTYRAESLPYAGDIVRTFRRSQGDDAV